jgi:ferredoxin, 2Fe-2S
MGVNPFIDDPAPPPPTRAYRLSVKGTDTVIDVDPDKLPDLHDGHPGSILQLLLDAGVDLDHVCGGVVACSTCHVYVQAGFDSAPEPIEEEEDMLDLAPRVRESSRLACQCVPDGSADVEIEIPTWNRNEVSEDH